MHSAERAASDTRVSRRAQSEQSNESPKPSAVHSSVPDAAARACIAMQHSSIAANSGEAAEVERMSRRTDESEQRHIANQSECSSLLRSLLRRSLLAAVPSLRLCCCLCCSSVTRVVPSSGRCVCRCWSDTRARQRSSDSMHKHCTSDEGTVEPHSRDKPRDDRTQLTRGHPDTRRTRHEHTRAGRRRYNRGRGGEGRSQPHGPVGEQRQSGVRRSV